MPNMQAITIACVVAFVAGITIGFGTGYKWQSGNVAELEGTIATMTANANAAKSEWSAKVATAEKAAAESLSKLNDVKAQYEIDAAKNKADRNSGAPARVYVAKCLPAAAGNPQDAATGAVDTRNTAELDPVSRQAYYDLKDDIAKTKKQLDGALLYIRSCQKSGYCATH